MHPVLQKHAEFLEKYPDFNSPAWDYLGAELFDGRAWKAEQVSRIAYLLPYICPDSKMWWHVAVVNLKEHYVDGTKKPVKEFMVPYYLRHLDLTVLRWEPTNDFARRVDSMNPFFAYDVKRLKHPATGVVYFIETIGAGFVKIGWAVSAQKRLNELQVGCPFQLSVAAVIRGQTVKDEVAMHRRFASFSYRGEWFLLRDELRDFVDSIRER